MAIITKAITLGCASWSRSRRAANAVRRGKPSEHLFRLGVEHPEERGCTGSGKTCANRLAARTLVASALNGVYSMVMVQAQSRSFPVLIGFSGAFLGLSLSPVSAATMTYELVLRLERAYVSELVWTPSEHDDEDWVQELCRFGEDCYPEGFSAGGPFGPLQPGDEISALFRFDFPNYGIISSECRIGSWDYDCFMSGDDFFAGEIFSTNPTSSIWFNLHERKMSYFGEAGNYSPFAEPGCTPIVDYFCDYSGYGADFTITSLSMPSVPVPPALALLASALFGLSVFRRQAA